MGRGGRRFGRAHASVESCHSLSVWGYWQPAQTGGPEADDFLALWEFDDHNMTLTTTRYGQSWTEIIHLDETPCHFGGTQSWFLCPRCVRRVGKLYLPTSIVGADHLPVNRWACRLCFSLTYEQHQARNLYWTFLHRAERIKKRWFTYSKKDEMYYPLKGQRRTTFNRRVDQYEELLARSNAEFLRHLPGMRLRK